MSPSCRTSVTASRYPTAWTVTWEELTRVTAYPSKGEKQWNCFSIQKLPDFRKGTASLKVPRLRPFVLLRMCIDHWWNDTDRGREKYWRKACPSATWSTTTLTSTDLASNPWNRGAGKVNSKEVVIVLWREESVTPKVPRLRPLVLLVLWKWDVRMVQQLETKAVEFLILINAKEHDLEN